MPAQNAEVAFYIISAGLEDLRGKEANRGPDIQLAYVKSKLFDDNLVLRKDRQEILRKLNQHFQVEWSMSRIKNADTSKLAGIKIEEIQVVEGTLEVQVPATQLNGFKQTGLEGGDVIPEVHQEPEKESNKIISDDIEHKLHEEEVKQHFEREGDCFSKLTMTANGFVAEGYSADGKGIVYLYTLQGNFLHRTETVETQVNEETVSLLNICHPNNQTQNQNSNTAKEESNMSNNIPQELKDSYTNLLQAIAKVLGESTPEKRQDKYLEFINTSEAYGSQFAAFKAQHPALNSDEEFFLFLNENSEIHTDFMSYISQEILEAQAPKGRFSLTGDGEHGPRGSWIAAASAVIGGGMEMFARDGVTVGAAIGTAGAAVGSFLLGDLVDKHVDHQYGRFVAAGMVGLAVGSVGAAVGRNLITGVQLPDFIMARRDGEVIVTDALAELPVLQG